MELKHVLKYSQSNGLSSYNIRKIIKDKNAFIWIATQDGLNRFDGTNFISYTKNAAKEHRVCGVDIRQIIEDTDRGVIWVLPGEFGLNAISTTTGAVLQTVPIPYQDPEEWRISMAFSHDKLWIGTSVGVKIYNVSTRKFEPSAILSKNTATNLYNFETRSLYTDVYGNIWAFFSGYGIVVYNGITSAIIHRIPLADLGDHMGTGNIRFTAVTGNKKNELFLGTDQGLRKITYTRDYRVSLNNEPCRLMQLLNKEPIEGVCWLGENQLSLASHNQLYRLNDHLDTAIKVEESSNDPEGHWLSAVQSIFRDDAGNIWLGCQQGLSFIANKQNAFHSYYFDEATNQKLDHVRSIYALSNTSLLIGLRNGIAHIDKRTGNFTVIDNSHLYHHIYLDKSHRIQVGRQDGIFIFENAQMIPIDDVYPEFQKFQKYPINSHVFIGDSIIVLGTENNQGILVWNYIQHRVIQIINHVKPSLSANIVNNIFLDSKERLWVLSDNVITVLSKDFKKARPLNITDNIPGQKTNLFFDMCEAKGYYWIAAYGAGIVQLDSDWNVKRIFNTQSGLSNDGVYQIFPVNNKLIITSNNGLSVLDLNTYKFKRYYQEDGLHSNSFEEVAGTMKDGLIYAGGVKGFTIIDPSKFTTNTTPPKVYINRVFIDRAKHHNNIDTTNLELKELEVPNDVLQTSLYFSGINYSNPERTTFAYRIRENNKDWVNIGTQNFTNLIGLSPGKYHFEVKAANEDDVWSQPITLTLIYLPKWYQTWWFKVLLALTTVGIGYAIYRVRINQIMKQHKIRKDVASDLHDDIGSSLNSVKVFAHLAMADPGKKEYIRNVEENLEQATIGLRDMIWILDDKLDSVDDLRNRLGQFCVKPAEAIGIIVNFTVEDGLQHRNLSKPLKRNLFLIAKEAINNSVKYAGCRNISVSFSQRNKKLMMTVKDDGNGFDTVATTAGYGLNNMKSRAEQIRFGCSIRSDASGTEITVAEI